MKTYYTVKHLDKSWLYVRIDPDNPNMSLENLKEALSLASYLKFVSWPVKTGCKQSDITVRDQDGYIIPTSTLIPALLNHKPLVWCPHQMKSIKTGDCEKCQE